MDNNYDITLEPAGEDTVQSLFFTVTPGFDKPMNEKLCQQINDTIKKLTKDYIWNKDELQVYVPMSNHGTDYPCLQSLTCFGDNMEDEWFIVHIALEISRQYKDTIIQISDDDGDFLLIESADYLQKWAKPENTDNRVFIYNNHIHIIQPEIVALGTKIDMTTALNIIKDSSSPTEASSDIEQAIFKRIGNYPEKILGNIHRAVVSVPSSVAAMLTLKPSLIAPIVDAYCNHDMADVKACKKVDFTDCVTIEVKFTKFLYAKLTHAKLMNCVKHFSSENDKKILIGIKLTCGFQMIMKRASTELSASQEYERFFNNLKKNGYFRDNIEGSEQYCHLLEKAKKFYSIVECPVSSKVSHVVTDLMSSSDFIELKKSIKQKQKADPEYTGDNEDWLTIHAEELNDMLLTRYGKRSQLKNNGDISSHSVSTELALFLKQTSDFEGIEPDHYEESEDDEDIDFEPDQFAACMEKMLNIVSTGDTDNVSEDSDDDDNPFDENGECESELAAKLETNQINELRDAKTIQGNIIQSMKEEKASTGPTSNLLSAMGVQKSVFLDSDDEDFD